MEPQSEPQKKELPFNNLFLNAGVVNGYNFWWMYAFGILASFLGYVLFQLFMLFPLIAAANSNGIGITEIQQDPEILFNPDKIGFNKNLLLAMMFGMFVFAFIGLYFAVTRLHKKPFKSIITAYDKIRFGRVFFAFAVWGGFFIIYTLINYFLDRQSFVLQFNLGKFLLLFVICILLLPIQTSTEEFIFRGYLMQGLAQLFKNGLTPLIITSALFGMLHMGNPEVKSFGWEIMFPYFTLFAIFLGVFTLLDEGMELALGIHCANNLFSALLVTTPNGVLKTDSVFIQTQENPYRDFLLWMVMAVLTFIIFWLKYRWKNFNLLIK